MNIPVRKDFPPKAPFGTGHVPEGGSFLKLIEKIKRIVQAAKIHKRHHMNFFGGWVFYDSIDTLINIVPY